ncbi:hypothetical protein [Agrobacterium fabrum]|uniref:hypothetical protein n=1 Tax=Agrobacterium fabrum TaxID=1176649 RepID=UPI00273FEF10|nr:hypothetical protein [Agrobacterium fabrum]WLP53183.1 hypothetical protein Q8X45_09915 [Agrobacterium fabrum]
MHIKPYLLEKHGVYVKFPLEDGDYIAPMETSHDALDPRLVAEVDRESDLTTFTAYVASELHADDGDMPTGATTELLFSKRKGMAAVLYDHPNISDAFIEWVFCSSADDALNMWKKRVRWPLIETSNGPVDISGGN